MVHGGESRRDGGGLGWKSGRKSDRKKGEMEQETDTLGARGRNHFWRGGGGGWRGVEKEGEERLASLKSPNPLTSVAGAKMEDHTAF